MEERSHRGILFLSLVALALLAAPVIAVQSDCYDGTGNLSIESTPAGAAVYIDCQPPPLTDQASPECYGEPAGITPLLVTDLSAGPHQLVLRADGYEDLRESVNVVKGVTTQYSFELTPLMLGNMTIESIPSGATVYVGQTRKGVASGVDIVAPECIYEPVGTTPVTISDIEAGTYHILLKADGFKNLKDSVEVVTGTTKPYSFTMTPIPPGKIQVNSTPQGAVVYLDGMPSGNTPVLLTDVKPGKHELLLTADGFYNKTKKVTVVSNRTLSVNVHLKRIPSGFGNLSIRSTPPGASIFLDDQFVNITPALLTGIPQGKHTMTVNLTGYRNTTRMVMVISDLTLKKNFIMHKIKPKESRP